MEKLAKTQLVVLASYSSPFVLLVAIGINLLLFNMGITQGPERFLLLSLAVPAGFSMGRWIYLRTSHAEVLFDKSHFIVVKGGREREKGEWSEFRLVSIFVDSFGRQSLRLYRNKDDFVEIPVWRTNADPRKFRDHVTGLIGRREQPSLQRAAAV